ncbi:hypothetical protein WJX77_003225 [Trebouxia sp. C0004]
MVADYFKKTKGREHDYQAKMGQSCQLSLLDTKQAMRSLVLESRPYLEEVSTSDKHPSQTTIAVLDAINESALWRDLEAVRDHLKPFMIATQALESDAATLDLVFTMLGHLSKHCSEIKDDKRNCMSSYFAASLQTWQINLWTTSQAVRDHSQLAFWSQWGKTQGHPTSYGFWGKMILVGLTWQSLRKGCLV